MSDDNLPIRSYSTANDDSRRAGPFAGFTDAAAMAGLDNLSSAVVALLLIEVGVLALAARGGWMSAVNHGNAAAWVMLAAGLTVLGAAGVRLAMPRYRTPLRARVTVGALLALAGAVGFVSAAAALAILVAGSVAVVWLAVRA
jgi:hypothetical protein